MNRHSVLHQSTICDSKTDAPSGGRGFKVMTIKVADPDKQFYPILKKYSQGNISACDAACEIQDMNIPGFDDPGASEVIVRAKMTGYGIPSPAREEA